jgi:hypothetical protein
MVGRSFSIGFPREEAGDFLPPEIEGRNRHMFWPKLKKQTDPMIAHINFRFISMNHYIQVVYLDRKI